MYPGEFPLLTIRERPKIFADDPTMLFRIKYITSDKRDDPTI